MLEVQSTPRFISLAIGDPTVFGNLKTPALAVEAVQQSLSTYRSNGYTDTEGSAAARMAVAQMYRTEDEFRLLGKDDCFLANGASGALHLAIGALCPRGSNILLPRPGFTYCVAAQSMGVECRYYDCLVPPPYFPSSPLSPLPHFLCCCMLSNVGCSLKRTGRLISSI